MDEDTWFCVKNCILNNRNIQGAKYAVKLKEKMLVVSHGNMFCLHFFFNS